MKKTSILTILAFAFGIFLASCDVIEEGQYMKEIPPAPAPSGDTTSAPLQRKVLILDFTGHKCGNCPKGHKMITNLEGTYHDAVVPVAIHCTSFATPQAGTAFATDFRTEEGNYLLTYMDLEGLPAGLVNTLDPMAISSTPTEWAGQFARYNTTEPEMSIEVTPSVDNGTMTANVKLTAATKITRKLSLGVYVVEDNIISGQVDYDATPSDIENYVHNHVFRMSFNGALGESVKNDDSQLASGNTIEKTYSKAIKSEWNIDNCKVVAFVYDSETKEVLQAEMVSAK